MDRGAIEAHLKSSGMNGDNCKKVTAPINVATYIEEEGEGGEKTERKVGRVVERELPFSLGDAVAMFGERKVFTTFIKQYVIELQGLERIEIQKEHAKPETGEAPGKRRASFMDALDLD